MICKLVDIPPQEMLTDFMENLAFGSWKREGREKARQLILEYFIAHGYGNKQFTADQLKTLFSELDAIALLFPKDGDPGLIDTYSEWRDSHRQYWFDKWYNR